MSKAEKLLAKGRSLESKGKREKALDVYRDGCRSQPYDPDLWTARGELARTMGQTKEAAESLFKASELYVRGGLGSEALSLLGRVLELDPANGGAKRLQRVLQDRLEEAAELNRTVPGTPAAKAAKSPEPVPAAAAPEPKPAPAPAPEPEPEAEPEAEPEPEAAAPARSPTVPPPPPVQGEDFIEVIPVEPSRPLYASPPPRPERDRRESGVGLDSRDIALDTLSLADRLPANASSQGHDILLEEEGKIDVVQAVASTLTSSPLLSELDSDLVRHLIDAGKLVHRGEEEVVFRQGDVGTSLFLILAGEVSVRWEGRLRDGTESKELARLRPGAFFGEMALLTNTGRSASVIAVKSSDFLEISRKSVRELIDRDSRILKLLMRFFRARLVGTLLQTSPVFKPFSRDERRRLVSRFRLRELAPDQTVITEGSQTDGLFLVLNGKLEVLQSLKASVKKKGQDSVEGLSVLLGTLSPGDVFGEISLLDGSTATASVRTRTRAWVLLLPRDEYDSLMEQYPQIKDHLAQVASERRERNKAAQSLGKQEVREDRLDPV